MLPCPPGFYCPIASVGAIPCPDGTYNPVIGGESVGSCSICPAKHFCPSASTNFTSFLALKPLLKCLVRRVHFACFHKELQPTIALLALPDIFVL
jgi:hypothetical protein